MDFNMVVIGPVFLLIFLETVQTCGEECITIGVIANGDAGVSNNKLSRYDHNISLLWHSIDTSEIYNIYRAVRELDATPDVDVIVLFDYDPIVLRMPSLFTATNKTLIKWGEKTHLTRQNGFKDQDNLFIDPRNICGTEETTDLNLEDPFCLRYQNLTYDRGTSELITLLGPRAIAELIRIMQWKTVFIFYETSTEIETSELVDLLSQGGVLLSLFNVNNVPDLHSLFYKIYQSKIPKNKDIKSIVVCRYSCAREILRTANTFDASNRQHKTLLKTFSSWLVVVYGQSQCVSRDLQACAEELDNVAIVAFPEFNGNGSKEIYRVLDSILLEILREEVHEHNVDFRKSLIDRLETIAATWSPTGNCQAYGITTLLHTNAGRSFNSVGYIEVNGNVVAHSDIFPNTNYGYNKRQFKVSTLPYFPFVKKREVNGTVIYEGFCIDLLDELANKFNFTYTITEPADGKWGSFDDENNITFSGLIGQLQREEVDIVAAPISTTSERIQVVDFSHPFFYDYAGVLLKKPDVNATKWRTLIDPFKWEVLVAIGLSLPTMTILAFLLEKYNPFYDKVKHAEDRVHNGGIHTWHSSFWYMYGALLCQGGVHLPDSIAGRTLVSSWWLFCIVIVGIYSGNLIAFLTVTKEKPPFNTLAEMTKLKGSFKWGTLSGTSLEMAFLKSNNPTYQAIGDGIIEFNRSDPNVLSSNPTVHVRKVKGGKYAWIGDKTFIEIKISTECSLMSIKEEFLPMKYALGFTKNSPHTAIFSEQIIKLFEGGLFQIWKRKWWPKDNFCTGDTLTEAKPISLMDVQSAFYVCFIGIFLGLTAFVSEIIVQKCRKRNSSNLQENCEDLQ